VERGPLKVHLHAESVAKALRDEGRNLSTTRRYSCAKWPTDSPRGIAWPISTALTRPSSSCTLCSEMRRKVAVGAVVRLEERGRVPQHPPERRIHQVKDMSPLARIDLAVMGQDPWRMARVDRSWRRANGIADVNE
jgi:hypothetical protein